MEKVIDPDGSFYSSASNSCCWVNKAWLLSNITLKSSSSSVAKLVTIVEEEVGMISLSGRLVNQRKSSEHSKKIHREVHTNSSPTNTLVNCKSCRELILPTGGCLCNGKLAREVNLKRMN